ncbi:MAG TPA: hypoxanthine phosphoribosyltransferase [Hyphomicrobiaceae bacterium]|nr:hypoxanthine phosphoribosyltransferase [Hyphomicrobiaceae bacterium]
MNAKPAPDIEVLIPAEELSTRVDALALDIARLERDNLLVVSVLTGSFVFAADLLRALNRSGLSPEVDFLTLSSYQRGVRSLGQVDILRDVSVDVRGRNILLIDDILDTGRTLAFAKDLLTARGAASITTCVLLDKDVPRVVAIAADFAAFKCPDVFVVGYGMDLSHRYRELPFVGRVVVRA